MDSTNRVSLFAAGAVAGAVCASGTLYCYQRSSQWWKERIAEADTLSYHDRPLATAHEGSAHQPARVSDAFEDEILSEQFTRNTQFFGREGQQKVHQAFVVVVGLGGVGSHAAHMLLRAGVGKLRIVDFDQVSLSSLNRHAVATRADVGLPKSEVLKEHFVRILPEADIDARRTMFTEESAESLLEGRPDFVIDAIDDINTKIALLTACKARGLKVLCACGAGAKADATRVKIVDVSEASCDPLARKVRHLLRSKHGISSGIPTVISAEKPRAALIPVEELTHEPHELQIVPNFRIRTVPVLGTTPAAFGMAAASWVLCELAEKPYVPEAIFRIKEDEFRLLLERLQLREDVAFGNADGVTLDVEDLSFLARDVWRAKSARAELVDAAAEKGLSRFLGSLHFTRWDRAKPADVDNLLLLTAEEADDHDQTSLEGLRRQEPAFHARVERVLENVRRAFGLQTAPSAVRNPLYEQC